MLDELCIYLHIWSCINLSQVGNRTHSLRLVTSALMLRKKNKLIKLNCGLKLPSINTTEYSWEI